MPSVQAVGQDREVTAKLAPLGARCLAGLRSRAVGGEGRGRGMIGLTWRSDRIESEGVGGTFQNEA